MNPATLEAVRRELLAWYDGHRRDLPWRRGPGERADPYAVWVSEIMLQQTRVDTVRPYYERWIELFPTPRALAAAPEDSVLKAWEGLGYYSRARNLHRAVREVVERHGGEVPEEVEALRALPGVGRYTAGAVASIAFGREEPVVDGNVRRVFARLLDLAEPTDSELWETAARLVAGERPGDLNQALMELGATICKPRSPLCGECPAKASCRAFAAGTVGSRPARKVARPVPVEHHGVAVVIRDGRVLLAKRPATGLLAGLWEFPGARRLEGEEAVEAARRAVPGGHGMALDLEPLCRVSHAFTHVHVVYDAFVSRECSGAASARQGERPGEAWVEITGIGEYPLPRAQQRIAAALRDG